MSKHTPGPWFVATNGSFRVASITSTTGIYADQMPKDGSLTADASLIAAAPDLLEALRWTARALDHDHPAAVKARAAIAKVEGEKA